MADWTCRISPRFMRCLGSSRWSRSRALSISICATRIGSAQFIMAFRATLLPFQPNPDGGYLAFLGRIAPEKRPDRAIEIAARSGMPLKIAGVDQAYWEAEIRPMIAAHPNVEFIGEIGEDDKAGFLAGA